MMSLPSAISGPVEMPKAFRVFSGWKFHECISHWKPLPSSLDAAIKKFLETGGAPRRPPNPVS
jgi:hypothetical protein